MITIHRDRRRWARRTVSMALAVGLLGGITAQASAAPEGESTKTSGSFGATAEIDLQCYVPPKADDNVLTTVYNVAVNENVSDKVLLATFEAGWVESRMNDLSCGHDTSIGVFQQRPNMGWVNAGNPAKATYDFLHGNPSDNSPGAIQVAAAHPGWSAGKIAQTVQISDFPGRYDRVKSKAESLIARAAGTSAEWPVLKKGAKGKNVTAMKYLLRGRGYNIGTSNAFGDRAERVVSTFKGDHGLPRDGVMGPAAWKAIVPRLQKIVDGDRTRGEMVVAAKVQLKKHGVSMDQSNPWFTEWMGRRISDFKSSRGLRSDEVVGAETWRHLLGSG